MLVFLSNVTQVGWTQLQHASEAIDLPSLALITSGTSGNLSRQFSTILYPAVTGSDGLDAAMATNIRKCFGEEEAGERVTTAFPLKMPVKHFTQLPLSARPF